MATGKGSSETDRPTTDSRIRRGIEWITDLLSPSRKKQSRLQGRRKKTKYYYGFSKQSLIFLGLALFQAVVVAPPMITIIVVGEFNDELIVDNNGTTYDELSCSEKNDLRDNISSRNFSNITEPDGLGEDKLIYVILFLSVVIYSFFQLCHALHTQNIVEVCAFVILNILVTVYACVQVYQFRAVGNEDGPLTDVGYIALGNAIFLLLLTILFVFMLRDTYFEFGWKMYKKIRRSEWRFYHRWYQILMSLGKLLTLFIVIFELGQCILFLDYCDAEFYLSILIMISAIIILILSYFIVRRESRFFTISILGVSLILLAAYLLFKIIRFSTRSCPLCKLRNDLPFSRREQTFEHLIMLAAITLILCITSFLVLIVVYFNYNKGLRDQFRSGMKENKDINLGGQGGTVKLNNDEMDSSQPSSDFKLEPQNMEEGTDSLGRHARNFFERQTRKGNPLPRSTLASVSESKDETIASLSMATPATTTPPELRPNVLPLRQKPLLLEHAV